VHSLLSRAACLSQRFCCKRIQELAINKQRCTLASGLALALLSLPLIEAIFYAAKAGSLAKGQAGFVANLMH